MLSLLDPIRIGEIELPNSVVMAPLIRLRGTPDHVPTPIMIEYYTQRAESIFRDATVAFGWFWVRSGVAYPLPRQDYFVAAGNTSRFVTRIGFPSRKASAFSTLCP